MSAKEERYEIFFFLTDEDKLGKNFHGCYKNWPAITASFCMSTVIKKDFSINRTEIITGSEQTSK